jgi:hypothetical protein
MRERAKRQPHLPVALRRTVLRLYEVAHYLHIQNPSRDRHPSRADVGGPGAPFHFALIQELARHIVSRPKGAFHEIQNVACCSN